MLRACVLDFKGSWNGHLTLVDDRLKTLLGAMLLYFLRIMNSVFVRLFEIVFGEFINFSSMDFI